MRMRNRWLIALWGGLALASRPALGETKFEFELDDAHSAVVFKVLNKGVSYVHGRFNDLSGTMVVDDREKPKTIDIKAEIKSKSIDTNNKGRDKHLKNDEFFDIKKHKTIAFATTECKLAKDGKEGMFELTGDLTLLGQTHPITVTFEITGSKKMGPGKHILGGETTFTIKRSEWGMTSHLDGIADDVTITVSLQAVRDVPPAG